MQNKLSISKLGKSEKISLFSKLITDYINVEGIFSDETENFVNPTEPLINEKISIKIRTSKNNVDSIFIFLEDKKISMNLCETDEIFDYYNVLIGPFKEAFKYYFIIIKNSIIYYYNKKGLQKEVDSLYNFCVIPNFKTPNWAKGAVMYQIYVDRFFNGETSNDVVTNEYLYLGKVSKKIEDWESPLENEDICNFYGGDLQGVINKIGYLKELGIDVIYFNPIFVSPSNHKYDIQDYDYIDPHYGVIINDYPEPLKKEKFINRYANMYLKRTTDKENLEASNKLMISLIEIAHKNGIKVILDGVFNHCGAFNKWLDKEGFYYRADYPVGAYRDEKSIYHDFFKWYDKAWPNNDCYDSWWGFDNHPKLNFEGSKVLYDYIINIGAKWVKEPFNADGWRLDVGADLGHSEEFNHKFWQDFRDSVKKANPEAIILAEHYGDPINWLKGEEWDTVMNYDAFMEPLTWFLTGMEKHSEDYKPEMLCNAMSFENSMRFFMSRFTYQSLYCSMNQLSNHDHSRFLTRTNRTVGRLHTLGADSADRNTNLSVMMEAVIFQMTWPGAPTIYYGDEVGLTGWTDPDNRRPFPWGRENNLLLSLHKEAIKMRKENISLLKGSVEFIFSNYGIICFARWYKGESIIVILNNNFDEKKLLLPVWKANIKKNSKMVQLISTANETFFKQNQEFDVKAGQLLINMPPYSSIVLKNS